jgi:NAD(P)-dependent dehydrogenase (short-subunit alcohol dehydrogenase family)
MVSRRSGISAIRASSARCYRFGDYWRLGLSLIVAILGTSFSSVSFGRCAEYGVTATRLLLPPIKQSAPARIVNVASAGQQPIDFSDVMLTRGYSGTRAYCQSKLAQIMFTVDLAGELRGTGVTVNALHPATYMDTTMVRRAGITPLSSVEEGAEAILNLATSPALEGRSGLYFNGLQKARANGQAYDAEARQPLEAISLELTGLSSQATLTAG